MEQHITANNIIICKWRARIFPSEEGSFCIRIRAKSQIHLAKNVWSLITNLSWPLINPFEVARLSHLNQLFSPAGKCRKVT